ncbi:MAG: glycosyltransferase family 2 protein, partial [Firmicutes bacterium]|nr:glycosyltransferase family 2 protein [Bacillota bacterium]
MKHIKAKIRRLLHRIGKTSRSASALAVDAEWYLNTYPDVAAAGLSAQVHYQKFGMREGRLPMPAAKMLKCESYKNTLPYFSQLLWAGYSHVAMPELERVISQSSDDSADLYIASKQLADWYFCQGEVQRAIGLLDSLLTRSGRADGVIVAALYRALLTAGEKDRAQALLAKFSQALYPNDAAILTQPLNALWRQRELLEIEWPSRFVELALLSAQDSTSNGSPDANKLVSVIMPVYNAAETIEVALKSVLGQTYTHLEVIVVDDCSDDNSVAVVEGIAQQDARVRIIRAQKNNGAYAARNLGVRHSTGEMITVHDSDDWSHPQKVERQVQALNDQPDAKFSISYWVRVLPDLRVFGSWLLSNPVLQLNHSSALFHREVIERCGLWDEVRVAADAEYLRRVEKTYGKGIEVLPTLPLSLSLVHPQSLTQTKATHVSSIFFGLRRLYREAMDWCHRTFEQPGVSRLNASGDRQQRLLPAPLGNLPHAEQTFNSLLIADFSRWSDTLETLLDTTLNDSDHDLVLLHIPSCADACLDPVCDSVWAFCQLHGVVFLHPGIRVQVERVVLSHADLILQRPDALPQVELLPVADGESDVLAQVSIQQPAQLGYVSASMVRALLACGGQLPSAAQLFDAEFYLAYNPDVAAANISAFEHYTRFGQQEGRQGFQLRAAQLETRLWQGEAIEPQLIALCDVAGDTPPSALPFIEQAQATWALARWYASQSNWQAARHYAERHFASPGHVLVPAHRGPWLVWFNARLALAESQHDILALQRNVLRELSQQGGATDVRLALASVASALGQPEQQFEQLRQVWSTLKVAAGAEPRAGQPLRFDDLPNALSASEPLTLLRNAPLVSVIIPCHNSAQTLTTALRSLLAQTWPNLEVIVVDDASSDAKQPVSASLVREFELKGIPLKVERLVYNQGAYAARNAGLALARGEFITTHDADDWSHPQKIAHQVQALLADSKRVASISYWVRADDNLQFSYWRPQSSWLHPNMSSLMMRRSVFDALGYWDRVSVSGDTEYFYRIQAQFGPRAIVEVQPNTPLAVGRHSLDSLTQISDTHIRTQFAGLRYDYIQAARAWHAAATSLHLPAE